MHLTIEPPKYMNQNLAKLSDEIDNLIIIICTSNPHFQQRIEIQAADEQENRCLEKHYKSTTPDRCRQNIHSTAEYTFFQAWMEHSQEGKRNHILDHKTNLTN